MENIKIGKIKEDITALFGPAYKGIPIAVSTSIALAAEFDKEINFCFNRKETKDHGEGGVIVGYNLKDGDSILMVEDVITAGTAVRETLPVIKRQADAEICGLIISVDRMERGTGEKTAIQEIREEFGIETFPIVTVREIIDELHNVEIDGGVIINDDIREKMENYLEMYCTV
jgi:orotate phosphoribosyltransferase